MSLLIKALEQAAKDRDGTKGGATASPVSSALPTEPTLEPAPSSRTARTADHGAASTSAAASDRSSTPLSLDAGNSPRRPAPAAAAALAQIDAQQQRARAAAVMQASENTGRGFLGSLRGSPVLAFGILAALFASGFGVYVYLQIARPGFFVRQAPPRSPESTPMTSGAPVSQPGAPSAGTPISTASDATTSASGPASASSAVSVPIAAPATGSVGSARATPPIPTASIVAAAPETQAESPRAETKRDVAPVSPRAEPVKPAATPTKNAADSVSPTRERISVTATTTQPQLNPALTQAYTLLQSGKVEEARSAYSKLIETEPLNVDGLLGLAFIAAQQNRSEDATNLYLRILQINPRHAAAQAALIGLMGRVDPIASETRMKQLLAREPSAFLHFILGNLYADQSMWAQAQQAYFQAHHLEPDNADYAYNLAVGLDHLGQNKVALDFYRRAEQLAAVHGRANFNLSHARERIGILSSLLQ